eukprot:SAG31_NODE_662_length_13028_cov_3.364529_11_plen_489_part_00
MWCALIDLCGHYSYTSAVTASASRCIRYDAKASLGGPYVSQSKLAKGSAYGLAFSVSADGITGWRDVMRVEYSPFDTQTVGTWDAQAQRYAIYTRGCTHDTAAEKVLGFRCVRRIATCAGAGVADNLRSLANCTEQTISMQTDAVDNDTHVAEDRTCSKTGQCGMPTLDYYGGMVWSYENHTFMFPQRTWHWSARKYPATEKTGPESHMYAPGIIDVGLAVSRDGGKNFSHLGGCVFSRRISVQTLQTFIAVERPLAPPFVCAGERHSSPWVRLEDGHRRWSGRCRLRSSLVTKSGSFMLVCRRWMPQICMRAGVFKVAETNMMVQCAGQNVDHNGDVDAFSKTGGRQSGLSVAKLRRDGFVSLTAPLHKGTHNSQNMEQSVAAWPAEVVTKPLGFEGTRLELNMRTSGGGSVQVELQDGASGDALPGFALSDCVPMIVDSINATVIWNAKWDGKANSDVSRLQSHPAGVRVRLQMVGAQLFALQFVK